VNTHGAARAISFETCRTATRYSSILSVSAA
jgi:hypothetical protein